MLYRREGDGRHSGGGCTWIGEEQSDSDLKKKKNEKIVHMDFSKPAAYTPLYLTYSLFMVGGVPR